jgi:hypothetical protein
MKNKLILSAILAVGLVGVVQAQAQQAPAALTLPSQLSGAVLVERKATVAVTEFPFKTWTAGKVSLSIEGLGGMNLTSNQGAIGTAIIATYQFNPHVRIGLGLGTTLDISKAQPQQLSFNNSGAIVVFSISL